MAQAAGTVYTIFKQKVWVAPLGTALPPMSTPYGGEYPTGWKRVLYTEEGAMITPTSPQEDIEADEGPLGIVPEGGDQINISFTSKTPDMDLVAYLSNFNREVVAEVVGTAPEPSFPAYERFSLAKEGKPFMIAIEGTFDEGGLTSTGGFVRAFGYKVQQTEEVELQFRSRGADSVFSPAANVRCLRTFLDASQTENTGIQTVDERFDLFVISNPAA